MTAIGEALRRERLRQNLELGEISQELKIPTRTLDAIENEDFKKIPGGVFAKSFVRQYARFLGLDEEEMAAEVQRILEPQPVVAERNLGQQPLKKIPLEPMKSWERVGDAVGSGWGSALPALALFVAAMVICSAAYAWWQWSRRPAPVETAQAQAQSQPAPAPPAPTPQAQTTSPAPANTPAEAKPGEAQPAEAQPAQSQPPQAQPANAPSAGGEQSADRRADSLSAHTAGAPVPQPQAGAQTAQPAAVQTAAATSGPVHVELSALEAVWVRVRENGKYVFSATLEPNQSRTVDAAGTVELLLGNAGGINISLNGKPIGAVGPKGQVRTVQLNSGGFKIVSSKPAVPVDPL